jgi:hypothetical protein
MFVVRPKQDSITRSSASRIYKIKKGIADQKKFYQMRNQLTLTIIGFAGGSGSPPERLDRVYYGNPFKVAQEGLSSTLT